MPQVPLFIALLCLTAFIDAERADDIVPEEAALSTHPPASCELPITVAL